MPEVPECAHYWFRVTLDGVAISKGRHGYISTDDYELDSGCYYMRLMHTYWYVHTHAQARMHTSTCSQRTRAQQTHAHASSSLVLSVDYFWINC